MYLCGMRKLKNNIITWLCFTILTFFLYDLIWAISDFEWLKQEIEEGCGSLWVDLCYSALFAFYSICVSSFIVKYKLLRRIKRRRAMVFGLIMIVFNMSLSVLLEEVILDYFTEPVNEGDLLGNAYFMGLISSVLSLIFTVDYYLEMTIRQRQENVNLQMQLLQMQLNPHFVFNSLSVLACLIDTNPKQAEKYTVRLSKIYRYILGNMNVDTVSIRESLAFAKDYMALLKLRYENVVLDIHDFEYHDNEGILSLCLQVLIENAVKHNAPGPSERLMVSIDRDGDLLVVSNNLLHARSGPDSAIATHRIGLTNIKKRYLLMFNRRMTIEETSGSFKVYVPIIKTDNEKSFNY